MFNTDVLEQKILSYNSFRNRVMKNILDLYAGYVIMISNII